MGTNLALWALVSSSMAGTGRTATAYEEEDASIDVSGDEATDAEEELLTDEVVENTGFLTDELFIEYFGTSDLDDASTDRLVCLGQDGAWLCELCQVPWVNGQCPGGTTTYCCYGGQAWPPVERPD